MPELPEVERAVTILRHAIAGKTIARIRCHHPAQCAQLGTAARSAIAGRSVIAVRRRGKLQLIDLSGGTTLRVHFRMAGDWVISDVHAGRSRYARVSLEFTDGMIANLDDARALSTIALAPTNVEPAGMGPEADDPSLTGRDLHEILTVRKAPIKPVLLDQRTLAGLGNIYAAEALWAAKLDPRRPASGLTLAEAGRLLRGIRAVLAKASGARYRSSATRFAVYDREGEPCRRCRGTIERLAQAGRSTYFCPSCQC